MFLRLLINNLKKKVTQKIKEIVAQGAQPPIMIEKKFVSGIIKRIPRIQINMIKTETARKFWLTPKYLAVNQIKTKKERTANIMPFPLTQNHYHF